MKQSIILSVLAVCIALYVGFLLGSKHQAKDDFPIPEGIQADMYFDIGQYYFNHDEDQGPPYDRALARQYYEKALALDPEVNELAWHQLGRLDFIDGDFDGALAKFATQMELFGERVPSVWYMKGLTYGYKARQTGDPADWRAAELAFINYLPFSPEAPWTRVDLAWIYFAQGKYADMVPVLEEGLEYRPRNPWLLNMYGLALLNTDQAAEALDTFREAKQYAAELTEADWGRSYPGNNPALWGEGLAEFRAIIEKNIELASSSAQ